MATQWREDDELIDPKVSCTSCAAVCCRLTVLVTADDKVPAAMIETNDAGLAVLARGEAGWCVALDLETMRCGIYDSRPDTCRRFTMGSGYCRHVREVYEARVERDIPLVVIA